MLELLDVLRDKDDSFFINNLPLKNKCIYIRVKNNKTIDFELNEDKDFISEDVLIVNTGVSVLGSEYDSNRDTIKWFQARHLYSNLYTFDKVINKSDICNYESR